MICPNCQWAGDASKSGNNSVSELLHAKCNYIGCYCQHKVG